MGTGADGTEPVAGAGGVLAAAVAADLGLELVRVLDGHGHGHGHGDGGAGAGVALVRARGGGDLVLKVRPGRVWASQPARAAVLGARVRAPDHPVPRHVDAGVCRGVSWSLQERLPGDVPRTMSAAHAGQLLALLRRHRGAAAGIDTAGVTTAGIDTAGAGWAGGEVDRALVRLSRRPDTAALAGDLVTVLRRRRPDALPLRTGDVVHGAYDHRHYLAVGDRVTGVVAWEGAEVGDWRLDLVGLACRAAWHPERVPPPVARLLVDDAVARCEPEVLAVLTALVTLRSAVHEAGARPRRLPAWLAAVDRTTRAWLRPLADVPAQVGDRGATAIDTDVVTVL